FPKLHDLVFGGHDVRTGTVYGSAVEIYRDTGTIPYDKLEPIKDELDAIDSEIKLGTARNCGPAIQRLATARARSSRGTLQDEVARPAADMRAFQARHGLDSVIVVNLASTEPPIAITRSANDPVTFTKSLRANGTGKRSKDSSAQDPFRASTLYAAA